MESDMRTPSSSVAPANAGAHPMPRRSSRPRRSPALRTGLGAALAIAFASTAGAKSRDVDPQVQSAADALGTTLVDLQAIPGAFPAASAVVVQGGATPLRYVEGIAHVGERGGGVDAHTRFYIASQTKSFMALLAAHLDEAGVLPLDTTLAQVWPQLALPAPADPAKITLADLLSHEEGLKTDTLNFVTAYVRAIPASDYPAMLSRYTESRPAGFRYSNLGDLVYGAALEARTGRPWQDWLESEVLHPLRLDEVHARSSTVPERKLAWNHRWNGSAWMPAAPKPDALMHAAGGLYASTDAMATWMRANLRRRSPTGSPSARAFERAQAVVAQAGMKDGEIDCDGYSLGWYSCAYRDQRVLLHPGSYTGVSSVRVLVHSRDAGLSLVMTSDSAMEGTQLELLKAFVGQATGHDESARLAKVVVDYPARLARTVGKRGDAVRAARAEAAWGGFAWKPSGEELRRFSGSFRSERFGRLDVTQEPAGLVARLGELRLVLEPAAPGLFGASESSLEAPLEMRYADDVASLQWKGETFLRIA
jgi:CubicO group peptidase (beta-lactamase class C family)